MLRFVVLLLLLANGLYFAWTRGYLAALGQMPAQQSEPQRLANQIKPEAIRLLNAVEAKRLEQLAAAPAPKPVCLQSSLLSDEQAARLSASLTDWPAGSWVLQEAQEPARWIVYMGKYPNAEVLAKKKEELKTLGLLTESLKNSSLELGLSLGAFATEQEAKTHLTELNKRGVRTARVQQEFPQRNGQILKFPAVDEALKPRVETLKSQLRAATLNACKA